MFACWNRHPKGNLLFTEVGMLLFSWWLSVIRFFFSSHYSSTNLLTHRNDIVVTCRLANGWLLYWLRCHVCELQCQSSSRALSSSISQLLTISRTKNTRMLYYSQVCIMLNTKHFCKQQCGHKCDICYIWMNIQS